MPDHPPRRLPGRVPEPGTRLPSSGHRRPVCRHRRFGVCRCETGLAGKEALCIFLNKRIKELFRRVRKEFVAEAYPGIHWRGKGIA